MVVFGNDVWEGRELGCSGLVEGWVIGVVGSVVIVELCLVGFG